MKTQRSRQVAIRVATWLALVVPASSVAMSRREPNLELFIPLLLALAIPLVIPKATGTIKLLVTIPLTIGLIIVGSQLPSTIVVLGFVLAEIAVKGSTRAIAWSTSVSILTVGVVSVLLGDADNLRPLWLVHGIGIFMFVALGIAIRERTALVAETKRSLQVAEMAHQTRMAEAITQERLNISRELHNRLGHQLTVISLNAEVVKQSIPEDTKMRTSIDIIGQSARQSLDEISSYLESLREKPELGDPSNTLLEKFDRFEKLGLKVSANVSALPENGRKESLAFVDDVLEELLMNARKYGDGNATYQQEFKLNTLVISLTNESTSDEDAPSSGGFGLKDITDRAAQIGASFTHGLITPSTFMAELTVRGWS